MAEVLSVKLQAMAAAARSLGHQADELKAELSDITKRWGELSSTWTGLAASAFDEPWEEWHHGAVTVAALLADHAEAVQFAADAFAAHDQAATDAVRSLPVGPSPL